jgi:hypothetical protein
MGQYYKFIILANSAKNYSNKECIILVLDPRSYDAGSKLMEHSYLNTKIMNTVEYLISKHGKFYKSRIVWTGDYADEEPEEEDTEEGPMNLYRLADDYSSYTGIISKSFGRYIVNHTKKLYVDKERKLNDNYNKIHPLPLLIAEGNGRGGGDYSGQNQHLCGSWARDVISMEEEIIEGYEEFVCDFEEF